RTLADVLPWTTRIAIAAGFEPAFSAPEVSVAYTTGQGGCYGARATATPEEKFGRGTIGYGFSDALPLSYWSLRSGRESNPRASA
ncbi:MAG: hypothetical protein WCA89_09740, partial [Terracidiphilus sp.]